MKHYYITNFNSENGFDEITEAEYYTIQGDEKQAVVNARLDRFGEYYKQEITAAEFKTSSKGGVINV